MHNCTSPETIKRKNSPYLQAWPLPVMSAQCDTVSRAKLKKEASQIHQALTSTACQKKIEIDCSTVLRPVVQPIERPKVWEMKKGQLFHFTWMWYYMKILHFRSRFTDPTRYLERYSPKGSCHLVEADMGHTLAQSCLIELWSGARRTCIKTRRQIHTMKMTLSTSICIYIYTYMQMIAYINI